MKQIKINDKLKYKFSDDVWNRYVTCSMYDKYNKRINVDYHAYIFALVGYLKFKKDNKEHSVVLIDGLPGTGKSTFVEGFTALDSAFNGNQLNMDKDIAWSMENLIKLMDSPKNINRSVWADEFIGGVSRFNQSNIGIKLKIGFITKRFKKNTYVLVVDELKEFPEKLIKMVDAYIHIKKIGFDRGYFDCWVNNTKIYSLWKLFKEKNNTWKSPWVSSIKPDCKGKFPDYRGLFLDVIEFDKRKMKETSQSESSNNGKLELTKLQKDIINLKVQNPGIKNTDVAQELKCSKTFVGDTLKKLSY